MTNIEGASHLHLPARKDLVRLALTVPLTTAALGMIGNNPQPHSEIAQSGHVLQLPNFAERFTGIVDPKTAYAEGNLPGGDTLTAGDRIMFDQFNKLGAPLEFWKEWIRTDSEYVRQGHNDKASGEGIGWIWGPINKVAQEYDDVSKQNRWIAYFDKGRMELNDGPQGPFVTNGLLTVELMKGSAAIPMIGDAVADNPAPTYKTFSKVSSLQGNNQADNKVGAKLNQAIDREGNVLALSSVNTLSAGDKDISYVQYISETGHNIPDIFWSYLTKKTTINESGKLIQNSPLFDPWMNVMGYPISEAYWTQMNVDGQKMDVLIQAFQRRILTYIPGFQSPYNIAMGNAGQHAQQMHESPTVKPTPESSPTATEIPALQPVELDYVDYTGASKKAMFNPKNTENETHLVIDDKTNLQQELGLLKVPIRDHINFKITTGPIYGGNQDIGNGHKTLEILSNMHDGTDFQYVLYYDQDDSFVVQISDKNKLIEYLKDPIQKQRINISMNGFIHLGLTGNGINVQGGFKLEDITDINKWRQLGSQPQVELIVK